MTIEVESIRVEEETSGEESKKAITGEIIIEETEVAKETRRDMKERDWNNRRKTKGILLCGA